jgi:hypothetical protein
MKLRILGVGDSITVGYPNGGDGDGYRSRLKELLSGKQASILRACGLKLFEEGGPLTSASRISSHFFRH